MADDGMPLAAASARRIDAASENSRRLLQAVLQRIAVVKNQAVADALGVDDSTVSRIVAGDSGVKLIALHAFLDICGLKAVPKSHICIDTDEWRAKEILLRKLMEREINTGGSEVDWNS